MQIDMHYYGTYAMARAAGVSQQAAGIIATAAQYVDDNVQDQPIELKDGALLVRSPTAHHLVDVQNVSPPDQRNVWVPFHFLPGNEVDAGTDDDYTERLRCRKDSEPARAMVNEAVARLSRDPHGLERIGVTAHVYADTFSHFGFSGVSSRRNRVHGESFRFRGIEPSMDKFLRGKAKHFFERYGDNGGLFANIKSWVAETATGALGHGGVATYPDMPYLDWGFDYEYPKRVADNRNNAVHFLEGCGALYDMFARVVAERGDFSDGKARPFSDIKASVAAILAFVGDANDRAAAWNKAAEAGELFERAEAIPPYQGHAWTQWLEQADTKIDSATALDHPSCRFHLAANAHRSWVLHELLPSRNLLVA